MRVVVDIDGGGSDKSGKEGDNEGNSGSEIHDERV